LAWVRERRGKGNGMEKGTAFNEDNMQMA